LAFPIVASGASARELDASFELFSTFQHLDREHERLLAELLAKEKKMPVTQIAQLERPQAYADAIVSSFRIPLLVLDRELRVLQGNPSFYKEFGLAPGVTEGKLLRDLDARQWDLPELLERLAKVLTSDAGLVDYEVVFPDSATNASRIFRVDASRIPGGAERVDLILLSIENETERRSRARALQLANQRKDEFLAMLAHELRNPLTPITHAVHLLQRESFGGSPHALYAMIERQSRRLVRLVDDLLDLARINRGHIELRNSLVNLTTVVQDAAESVRVRMEERRHEMTISVPCSPVCVDGDAVRLEQIVSNLLDNAAKYTNPGGRIEVNLTEQAGQAVLSVRDNGIGLASDDVDHIFELFDQVDRSLSRSGGGLGIGLTLVRRVLQLHHGTVEARSAGLGHGTEFIVRMPVSERERPISRRPGEGTKTALPARRRNVLIVDDHVDAVETMQMLAQHWGHDVSIAHSGPEALAAVETFHPEIALIDIGLPGISGYDVARTLRKRHPDMLLVAMTGHGRDEDRKAAYVAGFDAHLVKPLDLEELQALMSEGLASHALV
jgi:two-component system, chemotaxis family, CheB/CheR fusion protein